MVTYSRANAVQSSIGARSSVRMLCLLACIPPHPWEGGGTHRACETISLWVLLQLGEGLVGLPPLASNEGWCSRRRNFFPINAPDMGCFKLFDLVGYS